MTAIKWYKRDPDAALSGMMVLTLEERGAYNTVLDLIYLHDNNLMDDDRYIAGWLRVDVRVWRRIKTHLIELGKLGVENGIVVNFRATSEIDAALSRAASVSELNRIKGIKSGITRRKNKGLPEPTVEPKTNTSTPTPTTRKVLEDANASSIGDEVDGAFSSYNSFAKGQGFPVALHLNTQRRSRLKARLRDCGGIDGWCSVLARVGRSSFLSGDNKTGFKADLDFLLQEKSFIRLMEGRYDDREKKPGNGTREAGFAQVRAVIAERERRERCEAHDVGGGEGGPSNVVSLPGLR